MSPASVVSASITRPLAGLAAAAAIPASMSALRMRNTPIPSVISAPNERIVWRIDAPTPDSIVATAMAMRTNVSTLARSVRRFTHNA